MSLAQQNLTQKKGRGAVSNQVGRFEGYTREALDDGWNSLNEWGNDEDEQPLVTTLIEDTTRTIIARNDSPDISFEQSINPYRGCEHGCVYCFARPSHAYLGLSPGLDFESKLFFKPRAAELLEGELRKKSYKMSPIAMGTNTDPYQPVEREKQITRQILEVLQRFGHPVTIVTKNALITRDIDILAEMASRRLAKVAVSITTLDPHLARTLEPRAVSPARRLATVKMLSAAGIPTAVMTAPMIPALNDMEMEAILEAAANAGASSAGMVFIRLPLEITELFQEWLETHVPGKAAHIMSLIKQCRGGSTYQFGFGTRMTGEGPYAKLLRDRFRKAVVRFGLDKPRAPLDLTLFKAPPGVGDQLTFL